MRKILLLLSLIIMLIASVMISSAQSSDPITEDMVFGVVMFMGQSGELIEERDGTYSLVMQGIAPTAPYWLANPMFMPLPTELIGTTPANPNNAVGLFLVPSSINAWRLNETLTAEGWLATRDATVHVLLYEPDFFPPEGELIFGVEIIEVFGAEDAKGEPTAPRVFREAVLTIDFDYELMMGLDIGISNALDAMRWTCSGTDLQYAICECKRDVDEVAADLQTRIDGYAECNTLTLDDDPNAKK